MPLILSCLVLHVSAHILRPYPIMPLTSVIKPCFSSLIQVKITKLSKILIIRRKRVLMKNF